MGCVCIFGRIVHFLLDGPRVSCKKVPSVSVKDHDLALFETKYVCLRRRLSSGRPDCLPWLPLRLVFNRSYVYVTRADGWFARLVARGSISKIGRGDEIIGEKPCRFNQHQCHRIEGHSIVGQLAFGNDLVRLWSLLLPWLMARSGHGVIERQLNTTIDRNRLEKDGTSSSWVSPPRS